MEVGRVPTTYSPKAAPPAPAEPQAQSAPASQASDAPKGSFAAKAAQAQVSLADIELNFKVKVQVVTDDSTGRQVVKILSQDGKRVLRQMPPEQALELAAAAREGSVRNLLTSLA